MLEVNLDLNQMQWFVCLDLVTSSFVYERFLCKLPVEYADTKLPVEYADTGHFFHIFKVFKF